MSLVLYLFSCLVLLPLTLVQAKSQVISPQSIEAYAKSKEWLSYLQYYPSDHSRIDKGSKFFLTPNGNTDALNELKSSLDVFSASIEKNEQIICSLPARYKLLQKQFNLPVQNPKCPVSEKFSQVYSHQHVQIVFAGQYGNSPGSIMGHTLLKFVDGSREDYLNYTFGYMADVPESVTGFEYSYKGVFGGFKGYFVVGPYYEKVFEYNNIENRDIWEYQLKLTSEQRDFLINYIYELQTSTEISYFFAGRNCAYVLLAALQAVRPDKNLLEQMHFYVLPVETVKILNQQGLIESTRYRPSQQKILNERLVQLSELQKKSFYQSVAEKKIKLSDDVILVEAQMDYVNFLRIKYNGELPKDWKDYETELLIARSKLISKPPFAVEPPPDVLLGHGPFRISGFAGSDGQSSGFGGLEFRPGVHQQLENSIGYLPRSSLDFLVTEFSKYASKTWQINRVTLFDIALTPEFTWFFPQWTWQLKWQWSDRLLGQCVECSVHSFDYQIGATIDLNKNWRWGFLADSLAQHSNHFQNDFRLWLGPNTFMQFNLPGWSQMQLSIKNLKNVLDGQSTTVLNGEARFYNIQPHLNLEYGVQWYTDRLAAWKIEQKFAVVYDFSW